MFRRRPSPGMSRVVYILACLVILACFVPTEAAAQNDPDDDYFRLGTTSPQDSKKSAVVNPKKSALPVGPVVTSMLWNETSFAYFGGWGQLVSTDVHHFYIDTEQIASTLDEAMRKKPIYLQLQQKASDRVHIELFMSNGEYPTPSKHKFSCNTKTSPSVQIKLPPFTQPAHWLIRVQPSEPMSVWSKSLEYSLRLYEREVQTNTFSETWEGFFVTFLVVLGSTVGIVLYLRKLKNQEAKQHEEQFRPNGAFHNLNSDQQLLSLSEAQEQAKQGQLEQKDGIGTLKRGNSQVMDIDRVVENLMRRASPEPSINRNGDKSTSNLNTANSSATDAASKTRSQVFTRAAPSDASPSSTASSSNSSHASNTLSSNEVPSSLNTTTKPEVPPKPTASPTQTATTASSPSKNAQSQASNVKKMTAFWASPK